jgi:hypothetical protein
VSGLRKEIAELREQLRQEILAAGPGYKLPSTPAARQGSAGGRSAAPRPRSILDRVGTSSSNGASPRGGPKGAAPRVRNALQLVETRLASGDASALESVLATEPSYTLSASDTAPAAPVGSDFWMQSGGSVEVQSRRREEEVLPSSPEQLALEVLQIENARLR